MTADEFRTVVKGGHLLASKPESFVVDRPLSGVVGTFKKKAPECLEIQASSQANPVIGFKGSPHVYAIAKPTVIASAEKMEFFLQVKYVGNLAKEPEGGMYMLVADATHVDKQKTRIDVYRTAVRSDVLLAAVKGWASGQNLGCPDPASFM